MGLKTFRSLALVCGVVIAVSGCASLMSAVGFGGSDGASDRTRFGPTGALVAGSGRGIDDQTIHAPDMRFPLEDAPAYVNSQVWGVGGLNGPRGRGQCDPLNYSFPWRDNFCETRSRSNAACPGGKGHQGVDIRPAACEKDAYWAVATEAGTIVHLGSYTVTLSADSGREYRYMHLNMNRLAVREGSRVAAGDRIGLVSDFFGGTPTTIHLHFELRQVVRTADGKLEKRFLPSYTSLVRSYLRLLGERVASVE